MTYQPLMRPGLPPEAAPNKPPIPRFGHRIEPIEWQDQAIIVERDLPIPMRDGTVIYGDVYRPSEVAHDLPVILSWSPYGKHAQSNQVFWPPSGVNPEWLSPLTPFEGPDPFDWCPRGYAVAVIDPRGAWRSNGNYYHNGPIEAQDCYDTIEFLAAQPWANGRVGMTGVSYLACIQYIVAGLQPPSLKALNPWEGFSDWYREFGTHGGIPETGFAPRASDNIQYGPNQTENTWEQMQRHPLLDEYWRSKQIDLTAITQPCWVVASWADQGLHTRGTLEAFKQMASREKWLDIHGQKKWAHYYLPDSTRRRHSFFDHFLLEPGCTLPAWPRVQLEVREAAGVAETRAEEDYPLRRQQPLALYLGAEEALLPDPATPARVEWDSENDEVVFDHRFDTDSEFTGHAALRLWLEAPDAQDADIFVALEKLDRAGERVGFTFYAFYENGPVALGWLRASHRALDPERSSDLQPVHPHDREQPLPGDGPVCCDIELWPSSTLFRAGETLRLRIGGRDLYRDALPRLPFARHEDTRNRGRHVLHCGGAHDSRMLLPLIPAKDGG